jgi:hypothetical protein
MVQTSASVRARFLNSHLFSWFRQTRHIIVLSLFHVCVENCPIDSVCLYPATAVGIRPGKSPAGAWRPALVAEVSEDLA